MLEMIAEQRVVNEKKFGKPTYVKMSQKTLDYLDIGDSDQLLGCDIFVDNNMATGAVETLVVTDFTEIEVR